MNKPFIDYIVSWTGNGNLDQDITPGYAPRSIQATGTDSSGSIGMSLTKGGNSGTLELPSGNVTNALVPFASAAGQGFKVSGNANLNGWTYTAILSA